MRNVRTKVALSDSGARYATGISPSMAPAQPSVPTQSTSPSPDRDTVSGVPAGTVITVPFTANAADVGRHSTAAAWPDWVGATVTSTMFSLTMIDVTSRFWFG